MSQDVFDNPSTWLSSPAVAFSSWINRQRYRESSKTVYIAMFGKLAHWLEAQGTLLIECDAGHLASFLKESDLRKHHRHRYVRLAERVFNHLSAIGAVPGGHINPGRRAAKTRVGAGHNDPTCFFTREERAAIICRIEEASQENHSQDKWTDVRDQALIGVMLGGGAKVSQALRMTVNCMVMREEWLIKSDGRGQEHHARMPTWACAAVARWISMRAEMGIPGKALFTAQPTGARRLHGVAMHPASIFRRTRAFIEAAGVRLANDARQSAQTLRNSYAAALFEEGESDALVTEYLGLAATVSTQRLRAAWKVALESDRGTAGDRLNMCPEIFTNHRKTNKPAGDS